MRFSLPAASQCPSTWDWEIVQFMHLILCTCNIYDLDSLFRHMLIKPVNSQVIDGPSTQLYHIPFGSVSVMDFHGKICMMATNFRSYSLLT